MGYIVLLALAAAIFPSLLACVAIIISRPEPRTLLLAFYAGGVLTSVTSGLILLVLFNHGQTFLGSSMRPTPRTRSSPDWSCCCWPG
jgi:hypothetical protein